MISIIIPVLNEATTIGTLLTYLDKQNTAWSKEIIVVDGAVPMKPFHVQSLELVVQYTLALQAKEGRFNESWR